MTPTGEFIIVLVGILRHALITDLGDRLSGTDDDILERSHLERQRTAFPVSVFSVSPSGIDEARIMGTEFPAPVIHGDHLAGE